MASHSFFSEMKSINPAVISGRPYGQYSAMYGKDKIDKKQIIDEIGNEVGTTEIDINSKSFFRGGKGGGFLTTEFSFISNDGTRTEIDSAPTLDDTIIKNEVEFTHLELGAGISKLFGISVAKQSYKFNSKFSFTLGSNTFKEDIKNDISTMIYKVGGVLPLGNYRISSYFESASLKNEIDEYILATGQDYRTETANNKGLGLALGYVTNQIHLELGYEKKFSSGSPTRISMTGEILFWKIALGYTGRTYKNGFEDNDKLVYNQIALPEDSKTSRTEHIFNFAYGASGGFSFGASGSISKYTSQEKSPFLSDSSAALDVDIETLSYTLKVGYVY